MPIVLSPLAPADAIAALEVRGRRLDRSFHWQDRYAEEHAVAFTVAKSAGFDILTDIYPALEDALRDGTTERDFHKRVTPALQAKGWWGRQAVINPTTGLPEIAQLGSVRRLELIFDVNMRVSYAAGHWASFERNKAARPFLRYVHLEGQEHPRLHHQAWHNIVLPVDHPWWQTHACPNGWNCHCTLQSLSQRDVDQLLADGVPLRFEPPPEDLRPWTNKVTGETRMIDRGIDPGWDHNPGQAGFLARINEAFARKIAAATAELSAAGVAERVQSTDFAAFIARPQGEMPVLVLPQEVATAIKAQSRVALLSAATMRKQFHKHPDLTLDDYRAMLSVGRSPTLVLQDGDVKVVVMLEEDGRWRMAAIKATITGKALYVTSYRYAAPGDLDRMLRRSKILIDRR